MIQLLINTLAWFFIGYSISSMRRLRIVRRILKENQLELEALKKLNEKDPEKATLRLDKLGTTMEILKRFNKFW